MSTTKKRREATSSIEVGQVLEIRTTKRRIIVRTNLGVDAARRLAEFENGGEVLIHLIFEYPNGVHDYIWRKS